MFPCPPDPIWFQVKYYLNWGFGGLWQMKEEMGDEIRVRTRERQNKRKAEQEKGRTRERQDKRKAEQEKGRARERQNKRKAEQEKGRARERKNKRKAEQEKGRARERQSKQGLNRPADFNQVQPRIQRKESSLIWNQN